MVALEEGDIVEEGEITRLLQILVVPACMEVSHGSNIQLIPP